MVTLAVSTVALRLSGWANTHAKQLDGALAAFSLLAIALFIFWHVTKDDTEEMGALRKEPEGSIANSIAAGRDNFGDAISGRDIHKEVHHHYPPIAIKDPPISEPPRSPQPEAAAQKLKIVRLDRTIAFAGVGLWEERRRIPGGDLVWVVKVENPPDTPCGGYVFARLEFKTGSGEVGFVARAYWLGEKINTVKIDIGQRKSILLGMAGKGCWAYYDNPVDELPIPYTKRAEALIARQTKPIQQQYFPLTVPVECHLAVFSETGNKLVEAKYRIFVIDKAVCPLLCTLN
jgi:hypothetical protein